MAGKHPLALEVWAQVGIDNQVVTRGPERVRGKTPRSGYDCIPGMHSAVSVALRDGQVDVWFTVRRAARSVL
jgi:hypothetical protein